MNKLVTHLIIVIVPLIMSNSLHMWLVKKSWLSFLNVPVSEAQFGKNKTWRGFIFLVLVNSFLESVVLQIFSISVAHAAWLGASLGFSYALFELPNSFLKRRLGIASGETHSEYGFLFKAIDKSDSAFGVSLVYYLLGYVDAQLAFLLFLSSCLTHVVLSWFLVRIKIESSF